MAKSKRTRIVSGEEDRARLERIGTDPHSITVHVPEATIVFRLGGGRRRRVNALRIPLAAVFDLPAEPACAHGAESPPSLRSRRPAERANGERNARLAGIADQFVSLLRVYLLYLRWRGVC